MSGSTLQLWVAELSVSSPCFAAKIRSLEVLHEQETSHFFHTACPLCYNSREPHTLTGLLNNKSFNHNRRVKQERG